MASAAKSILKGLLSNEIPVPSRRYSIILAKIKKGLLMQDNYMNCAKTAATYQVFSPASPVNEMSGVIVLGLVFKGIPKGKIIGLSLHCLPQFHRAILSADRNSKAQTEI